MITYLLNGNPSGNFTVSSNDKNFLKEDGITLILLLLVK